MYSYSVILEHPWKRGLPSASRSRDLGGRCGSVDIVSFNAQQAARGLADLVLSSVVCVAQVRNVSDKAEARIEDFVSSSEFVSGRA